MNCAEIRQLLPHRYPFLMVDKIISMEQGSNCVGVKNVTLNEPCYNNVKNSADLMELKYPLSLQIESFAQVGALLCLASRKKIDVDVDNVMLAGSVLGVKIKRDVFPGDTLMHHVSIVKDYTETVIIGGEIRVVCSGESESHSVAEIESVVIAVRSRDSLFEQKELTK